MGPKAEDLTAKRKELAEKERELAELREQEAKQRSDNAQRELAVAKQKAELDKLRAQLAPPAAPAPASSGGTGGGSVRSVELFDQVVRKTLDPGYRFVAQQLDGWGSLCTPVGGSLSQSEVTAFANGLKTLRTDPALAMLATGIADQILNCCPAMVSPAMSGIIGNQVRRLTPERYCAGRHRAV